MKKLLLLLSVCLFVTPAFAENTSFSFAGIPLNLVSSSRGMDSYRFQANDNGRSDLTGSISLDIQETDIDDWDLLFWSQLNERDEEGTYRQTKNLDFISDKPGQKDALLENTYCLSDEKGIPQQSIFTIIRAKQVKGTTLVYTFTFTQNLQVANIKFEDSYGNIKILPPAEFFKHVTSSLAPVWKKTMREINLTPKSWDGNLSL